MSEVSKKVLFLLSGFVFILLSGTIGYMSLEEYEFTDALYLTIITVATVGYGDMVPHHPGGKILTVILVLVGVSFVMLPLLPRGSTRILRFLLDPAGKWFRD